MSELKVGQTVYAVKTDKHGHTYGFDDFRDGPDKTGMELFAEGSPGTIVDIYDGEIRVKVAGSSSYSYDISEVTTVPRGVRPVKATFDGKRPVRKPAKKVDGVAKTLYAIVKDGKTVGVHPNRPEARKAKKFLGGLKAGVTIVTYVPQFEIR